MFEEDIIERLMQNIIFLDFCFTLLMLSKAVFKLVFPKDSTFDDDYFCLLVFTCVWSIICMQQCGAMPAVNKSIEGHKQPINCPLLCQRKFVTRIKKCDDSHHLRFWFHINLVQQITFA